MDSRRARASVSLTDNTCLFVSEYTLPRLQHQETYNQLLAALHEFCGGSPILGDPLDVFPGARELLEEHHSEEDSVQPSPEDALNYLLDAAIDRFGYSAGDVFGAVFSYTSMTQHHEMAFNIKYEDLYAAVYSLSKHVSDFVSNRILALSPVDKGPFLNVRWKVNFKSGWVGKSVMGNLGEAEDDEIRRQIRIFRNIPEAGAMVGWLLEPLAHRYITHGKNDFVLFNMKSNGADPPHFTLVRDPPVPNNERFTKVNRKIVRLQSITNLSSCLENKSYYVPEDPNFPLFDAFTIELDRAKKSAILWVLQMTSSRKHGGSAKGYQKIREIITILKNELREDPPLKKSKTTAGQAAPLVQVRYLLVVPKDEPRQSLQWDFPVGWNQSCTRNDHRGEVYCLEVPLAVCFTIINNISSFEPIASRYRLEMVAFYCAQHIRLVLLWSSSSSTTISYPDVFIYPSFLLSLCLGDLLSFWASLFSSMIHGFRATPPIRWLVSYPQGRFTPGVFPFYWNVCEPVVTHLDTGHWDLRCKVVPTILLMTWPIYFLLPTASTK